eukprot:CAMPEP_0116921636 /NCGR_PEP_ID=MMETSP0467-20121206/21762_1 /TAXON_ID=283647 /ORGANISM="Mesodinium pulex, Strain SPMC105" /LENGTH=124 /DNA_ID=CAMNT_0004599769 /DNA_START=131 /DNA_END=505 /DNA_ORIENTATION=+
MLDEVKQTGTNISTSWLEEIDTVLNFLRKWKVNNMVDELDLTDFNRAASAMCKDVENAGFVDGIVLNVYKPLCKFFSVFKQGNGIIDSKSKLFTMIKDLNQEDNMASKAELALVLGPSGSGKSS